MLLGHKRGGSNGSSCGGSLGGSEYGGIACQPKGMEQRATHVYCLPSASRSVASSFASEASSSAVQTTSAAASNKRTTAYSDAGSSVNNGSAPSSSFSSPGTALEALPPVQPSVSETKRSAATEDQESGRGRSNSNIMTRPTSTIEASYTRKNWGLVSILRILDSPGIVLITLYHFPSHAMFGWPLQTDPRHRSPSRAIVFVTSRNKRDSKDWRNSHHPKEGESMRVLSDVLVTWMRHSADMSPSVKRKLGEREQDTLWLAHTMALAEVGPSLAKELRKRQEIPTHADLFPEEEDDDLDQSDARAGRQPVTSASRLAHQRSASGTYPQSILVGSSSSRSQTPSPSHSRDLSPQTAINDENQPPHRSMTSDATRSPSSRRTSFESRHGQQTGSESSALKPVKASGRLRKIRSLTNELSSSFGKSLVSPFSSSSSSSSSASSSTSNTTAPSPNAATSTTTTSSPTSSPASKPLKSKESKPTLAALQTSYEERRSKESARASSSLSTVPSIEIWSPTSPPSTSVRPPWNRGASSASSIEGVLGGGQQH